MSLEQGLRFGSSGYHRGGFGDSLGLGSLHQNNYQNDNYQSNLNHLFSSPHQSDHYGQSSQFGLQSLLKGNISSLDRPTQSPLSSLASSNYSSFQSPGNFSSFSSSHYNPQQNLHFPSTDSSSLFSNSQHSSQFPSNNYISNTSEPSVLGLSDISVRLEASLALSNVQQTSRMTTSSESSSSRSRNSTPLSWNPLGQMSATPLSSLTPSPTMVNNQQMIRQALPDQEEYVFFSDDEETERCKSRNSQKTPKKTPKKTPNKTPTKAMTPHKEASNVSIRGIQALSGCQQEAPAAVSSWSQVVRTSSSRLPVSSTPSPPPVREQTFSTASQTNGASHTGPINIPVTNAPTTTTDFHRGPKVDPRWPVSQQVFLGPIPMSISWDEIRNVFYTKVARRELLHFYVQSKPVNEVVYGQVVFDKSALANKILKEGPVKVRGVSINVTSMKDKVKADKAKK